MADQEAETSAETSEIPPGTLVPQAHGGALLRGNPGNKGGVGVAPSVIRQQLRGSFAERVKMLEEIADGVPYQRIDVPLHTILKYACCPNCGSKLKAKNGIEAADLVLLTIEGKASASVSDRIKSVDMLAKYGLGTQQEVSGPDGDPVQMEIIVSRRMIGDADQA